MNFCLQHRNTRLTAPYYLNYSYKINPIFSEGTLRNFNPMQNYFLFLPLCAKTNRLMIVPIEYLQCLVGGVPNCMYGHTFNLLYRVWMVDKLADREPTPVETQILNQLLSLQPHCNVNLYLRALADCLARDKEFLEFYSDPENWAPDIEFEFGT